MPRWGLRFSRASRMTVVTLTSYQASLSRPSAKDIVGSLSSVPMLLGTSSQATLRSVQSLRAIFLNVAQTESEPHAK